MHLGLVARTCGHSPQQLNPSGVLYHQALVIDDLTTKQPATAAHWHVYFSPAFLAPALCVMADLLVIDSKMDSNSRLLPCVLVLAAIIAACSMEWCRV